MGSGLMRRPRDAVEDRLPASMQVTRRYSPNHSRLAELRARLRARRREGGSWRPRGLLEVGDSPPRPASKKSGARDPIKLSTKEE